MTSVLSKLILGDPGADSRGKRQIKRANRCELKPGVSESLKDGRESPWAITFNGNDFRTCCFLFSLSTLSKFLDFSALWVPFTKTFFDGRRIQRARQKVDFSTHECLRSG